MFTYQPTGQPARVLIVSVDGGSASLDVHDAWEIEESDNPDADQAAVSAFLACMATTIPVLWSAMQGKYPEQTKHLITQIVESCFVDAEDALFQ